MKAYTNADIIRMLKRDLESEFKTVSAYLDTLDELNYKKNKKLIDALVLDSLTHATIITKELLNVQKTVGQPITAEARAFAMKEELALEHIYAYELERVKPARLKTALSGLRKAEQHHEELVKQLR